MWYDDPTTDDQIATPVGPGGPARRASRAAALLLRHQPEGLHPAPARRRPDPEDVPAHRLPRRLRLPEGLPRTPGRPGAEEGAALLHPLLRRATAPQKRGFRRLQRSVFHCARRLSLIDAKPTA